MRAISFFLFLLQKFPSKGRWHCARGDIGSPPAANGVACLPCVANKEGHLGRCDRLGRNYKVAFILTILVIEDNDKFAILYGESQLVSRIDLELPKAGVRRLEEQVRALREVQLTECNDCILNRVELKCRVCGGRHAGQGMSYRRDSNGGSFCPSMRKLNSSFRWVV